MKESELYEPVKLWLEEKGYEVFPEVQRGYGGRRADIIARNRPAVAAVEMKTSLSFNLIDQALYWRNYCHYVYIAIPLRKKRVHHVANMILRQFGIGLLEVNTMTGRVYDISRGRFQRPKGLYFDWDKILTDELRDWDIEGGTNGGGHMTPYKVTMKRVQRYMSREFPRWLSLNEVLDHCETHYASPKPSLAKALLDFEVEWCESKKEKGRRYFRYKGVS